MCIVVQEMTLDCSNPESKHYLSLVPGRAFGLKVDSDSYYSQWYDAKACDDFDDCNHPPNKRDNNKRVRACEYYGDAEDMIKELEDLVKDLNDKLDFDELDSFGKLTKSDVSSNDEDDYKHINGEDYCTTLTSLRCRLNNLIYDARETGDEDEVKKAKDKIRDLEKDLKSFFNGFEDFDDLFSKGRKLDGFEGLEVHNLDYWIDRYYSKMGNSLTELKDLNRFKDLETYFATAREVNDFFERFLRLKDTLKQEDQRYWGNKYNDDRGLRGEDDRRCTSTLGRGLFVHIGEVEDVHSQLFEEEDRLEPDHNRKASGLVQSRFFELYNYEEQKNGFGFDPAANDYKIARSGEDWSDQALYFRYSDGVLQDLDARNSKHFAQFWGGVKSGKGLPYKSRWLHG